jgi:hypothetical protein
LGDVFGQAFHAPQPSTDAPPRVELHPPPRR